MELSSIAEPVEPGKHLGGSKHTHHSLPICPFCGIPFTGRIKRSWLVKLIFRESESRRYVCAACKHSYYIISKEMR